MIRSLAAALVAGACLVAGAVRAEEPAPPPFTLTGEAGHPLVGRIWSVADKSFVTPKEVSRAAVAASFVLLGEIHDNPDHHALQAFVLSAVTASGRKPAAVLEMLPGDRQARVDDYLAEKEPTPDGFGAAVGWAELGWPDYRIYQPVIAAAMEADLPIIAGDVPKKQRVEVSRDGFSSLGEEALAKMALDQPLGEAADARLLQTLFEGHCEMMPREALVPMANVQRLRDAGLANAMLAAAGEGADGAVLIAGAGHVRADLAVPRYLRWRAPSAGLVTIAFIEVAAGETDPAAYAVPEDGTAAPYDFLWFTPRGARKDPCKDPCKELSARFDKLGKKKPKAAE